MSLSNATLLRVDAPPAVTFGGDVAAYSNGTEIDVRCVLEDPSFAVRRLIDDLELSSTSVLVVELRFMPDAVSQLVPNAQVLVQENECEAQLLRIDWAKPKTFDSLPHVQCLVRAA